MTLYVKVLQMMHHPVKRNPLPYVYASLSLSSMEESEKTQKSNALPPCWNQNTFRFDVSHVLSNSDFAKESLHITIFESRLFMSEEQLGCCDIPIQSLPTNLLIFQWANLSTQRQNLPKMKILILLQLTTDDSLMSGELDIIGLGKSAYDQTIFNAQLITQDNLLDFQPWDSNPVESKYFLHNHLRNPLEVVNDE